MQITVQRQFTTAVRPSANVLKVAAMFGLGLDRQRTMQVIAPTTFELSPGHVVFITGASGSGKSVLLAEIGRTLQDHQSVNVLRFEDLPPLPDRPLVDCFDGLPLEQVTAVLSLAGLNDAFVMLRRPGELSDGQRYRLWLAEAMALTQCSDHAQLNVVLADEFAATLDRITAAVIARNIRKWTRRTAAPVCFVAATTHDDLLEPLEPDVLIENHLGERIDVVTRPTHGG